MKRSIVIIIIIFFSLIGLGDASYLTSQHYSGEAVVCNIGGHTIGDCSTVTSSEYSVVAGIPLALIGAVYYFILFVLSAFMLSYNSKRLKKLFMTIVTLGFIGSLYFVYLQLFVLEAICVYCMVSAITTTILFILSIFMLVSDLEEKRSKPIKRREEGEDNSLSAL